MYILKPFMQRRKLRHRKVGQLVLGPTASKQQNQEGTSTGANPLSHRTELLRWEEPAKEAEISQASRRDRSSGPALVF